MDWCYCEIWIAIVHIHQAIVCLFLLWIANCIHLKKWQNGDFMSQVDLKDSGFLFIAFSQIMDSLWSLLACSHIALQLKHKTRFECLENSDQIRFQPFHLQALWTWYIWLVYNVSQKLVVLSYCWMTGHFVDYISKENLIQS